MPNSRNTELIGNVIGVLFFFSVPIIFLANQASFTAITDLIASNEYLVFCATYLFIFYIHQWLLVPRLYLTRKYIAYAFSIAFLLSAVVVLKPFDNLVKNSHGLERKNTIQHRPPSPPSPERFDETDKPFRPGAGGKSRRSPFIDIISVFLLLMIISFGIFSELIKKWRITEKRALQAESEKAHAELSFLKAQINPHFLFNTLNNIYSLAVTKNEGTADAIMKLSRIMRYVTDDVNEEKVPLENELACIKDYISLQKLGLGKKVDIDLSVEGDIDGKDIPPLLLMTFVENAFKHGTSTHEAASIVIRLRVTENEIYFFTQNRQFNRNQKLERRGIGIVNAKDRLGLMYPERHTLNVETQDGLFMVNLKISISK